MPQVVLQYIVGAGIQDPVVIKTKVENIPVDQELEFLNMTKASDVTVAGAGTAIRTVVLQTDAASDEMFPTADELKGATRKLLSGLLALGTPSQVTSSEPIVNP